MAVGWVCARVTDWTARHDLCHGASMPCNYYDDLNDAGLFAEDKQRRERDAKACAAHLKDLLRVHGPTPDRRLKGNRKGKEKAPVMAPC